jgi:tetratricopeptide (TPR) repeat protein
MKTVFYPLSVIALAAGLAGCSSGFTHVKPGQSARQYLKDRNAPTPLVAVTPDGLPLAGAPAHATGPVLPPLPDTNPLPALPDTGDTANRVADAYTRGSFAMQAGQDGEAILSLEEAVKMDPNFSDAWSKLVKLYERTGNIKKAAEAYKKLKQLGQPNGTGGNLPGGLGLIR